MRLESRHVRGNTYDYDLNNYSQEEILKVLRWWGGSRGWTLLAAVERMDEESGLSRGNPETC